MSDNRPVGPSTALNAKATALASPDARGLIQCKVVEAFIAAEPGTYLLHYGRLEGHLWVAREVVIGWLLNVDQPEPITANGAFRSDKHAPIVLHPDGRVHDFEALFETYEDWLADVEASFPAT